MAEMDVTRPAPRSLDEVFDQDTFPRQALRDSGSALVLFASMWHGKQDAWFVAAEGLHGTCVDLRGQQLSEMAAIYPVGWKFIQRDVWEFAANAQMAGEMWDVVTLDCPTALFQRCADHLELWADLARNVIILGCGYDTQIEPPEDWMIVRREQRSHFMGGTFWVVLQRIGQGISPDRVSACLVTRGDQPAQMRAICDTLPYDEIIVWDNSQRENWRTAGRYRAMFEARHDVVYFQDDDTLFTEHETLMRGYSHGMTTAVYGHGDNPDGYTDLPLVCGGALADRTALTVAWERYASAFAWTIPAMYEADFILGVLVPFRHLFLPFQINLAIAQHESRLCNQPWQKETKLRMTEQARALRDGRL